MEVKSEGSNEFQIYENCSGIPFDILPLFSAGRSRRLTLVPIIQSLAQLEKNYGKEGRCIVNTKNNSRMIKWEIPQVCDFSRS